jgi:hypothetical protein
MGDCRRRGLLLAVYRTGYKARVVPELVFCCIPGSEDTLKASSGGLSVPNIICYSLRLPQQTLSTPNNLHERLIVAYRALSYQSQGPARASSLSSRPSCLRSCRCPQLLQLVQAVQAAQHAQRLHRGSLRSRGTEWGRLRHRGTPHPSGGCSLSSS